MFCIMCGAKMRRKVCPNCGYVDGTYKISENDKYSEVQEKHNAEVEPDLKKVKESRKKLIVAIAAVLIAILAAAGVYLSLYLIKDAKYEKAISSLENGRAQKAAEEFEELGDYKDSEYYLEEAEELIAYEEELDAYEEDIDVYNEAIDEYEAGRFETALEMFEALGDFEGSQEYAGLCSKYICYNEGVDLMGAQDFESALLVFQSLDDFENSIVLAEECQANIDYIAANLEFDNGNFETAQNMFEELSGFEDSDNIALVCRCIIAYNKAEDVYNSGDLDTSLQMLIDVDNLISGSGNNFEEWIEPGAIKYMQGQCFYKQELYFSAYTAFNDAGDYKDSKVMADSCIQPAKTKELFINEKYRRNDTQALYYWTEETEYDAYVLVFDGDVLVSACYIKRNEKLRIEYPFGTYNFMIFYGENWFGEKEMFGSQTYDELVELTVRYGRICKVVLGPK